MAALTFHGAARTVTGSKFLLETDGHRTLVDCGLFQGLKELRRRNWAGPPVPPESVRTILLTHAHLDHSGYLPVFTHHGFHGPILATPSTCDLAGVILPDAGHLQEEDARWANRKGFSKHKPAMPLYTEEDARDALGWLRPVPFDRTLDLHPGVQVRYYPAAHILGAAMIQVDLAIQAGARRTLMFSGDLGRPNQPIIKNRAPLPPCDYLVLESTYGDRRHPDNDPKEDLARIVLETAERGGMVLIPAFAVGRTQELLYLLRSLQLEDRIPVDLPIYVDSPMAIHAIRVYMKNPQAYDLEMKLARTRGDDPLGLKTVHLAQRVEQSKAINDLRYPAIVISASGMATGGRVLHHLVHRLPDHRNTVLFVGYQAVGTRGRLLQEGAKSVKIHGRQIPVRARIATLDGLSAHADRDEILDWLREAREKPRRRIFLVHGEPEAAEALAEAIRSEFGLEVHIPHHQERVELT